MKRTLCCATEARLLASLKHRHIIDFYGASVTAPDFFIGANQQHYDHADNFLSYEMKLRCNSNPGSCSVDGNVNISLICGTILLIPHISDGVRGERVVVQLSRAVHVGVRADHAMGQGTFCPLRIIVLNRAARGGRHAVPAPRGARSHRPSVRPSFIPSIRNTSSNQ